MTVVAIERCPTYSPEDVYGATSRALSAALGVGRERLAGKRVLLKPNLLSARHPDSGVTTHPVVVGAVIDYFRELGAQVSVGDSPAGALRGVRRVWENTGMLELCEAKGVPLVNFEAGGWVSRTVNGRSYPIARAVGTFDAIVNLPKFKSHVLTLLTAGIKNLFGCVPGFRKSALHLEYPRPSQMAGVLVDIFSLVRPWITLVDAVVAMEGNGPSSGSLKQLGLIAASDDCVALDAALARIVGVDPMRVPTTAEAARRGMGHARWEQIDFTGISPHEAAVDDFRIPSSWAYFLIPAWLSRHLARFVWIRPQLDPKACTGCGECVRICPAHAITFGSGAVEIDRSLCSSCLCCLEACPAGAIEARMSRLARFLA